MSEWAGIIRDLFVFFFPFPTIREIPDRVAKTLVVGRFDVEKIPQSVNHRLWWSGECCCGHRSFLVVGVKIATRFAPVGRQGGPALFRE